MAEEFLHQPSWPFYNVINSPLDQSFLISPSPSDDDHMDIIINSSIHHFSDLTNHLSPDSSSDVNLAMITLSTEELLMNITDNNNNNSSDNINDLYTTPSPSIDETSPMETATSTTNLNIPSEETELGNQVSVFHLLKAYGEAMEAEQGELAEVIMASVSEKVTPAGDPLERLAFNLSKDLHKEADYIKQEAAKNFESAFRAFYQIFPYGRFAHFAANSAIIESIPADIESVHVVDFDIGEGVQWPPVIEALARMGNKSVTLTAVAWESETESDLEDGDWSPSMWNFDEVKTRLMELSNRVGLKMEINGIRIGDLRSEMKKETKKSKQWCVFNCMIELPHMRRVRGREVISEFLSTANESISESAGIVTRGEGGEPWEERDLKLGEFFEKNMVYYRSLLESIELSFPELAEARMALECLFVAPYVSSQAWIRKWTEMTTEEEVVAVGEKWKVSKKSLEEAKEMVKERQTAFGVRIGGEEKENQMVLEWNGTPLVRVSSIWKD
ncbi:Protein NODULATION SIGNALING PATHWAY 2 [Linum grandiflorum]